MTIARVSGDHSVTRTQESPVSRSRALGGVGGPNSRISILIEGTTLITC